MQQSYTKNYLKIYLWQGISMALNFVSMFVVVPYLSSNPIMYGTYTVCISVSIFLAYADFGFLGAGQKFSAEHFARDERSEEIKVIGFTTFVLAIFLALFSVVLFFLSSHVTWLVNGLVSSNQIKVASSLLLILALFTPVTLFQRLLQMIFGIRLEEFIVQRVNIVGNLIKILSVFYFFSNHKYDVVGYFLGVQIINVVAAIISLYVAKKRYDYSLRVLLSAVKFDKAVFLKTKNIAFVSLFATLAWILYYELDTVVISKFFGAKQVAIYAVGLTILAFFRSFFGILFSPFSVRFNHFIGKGDELGLQNFFIHLVSITAPLVIIPILCFTLFAKPLIYTWVGPNYAESVEIAQWLILCNLFAFISYPVGMLLTAKERQRELYFVSFLTPFVFWIGIIVTQHYWGLKSFAIFKFVAFFVSAVVNFKFLINITKISFLKLLKTIFLPMLIPILFLLFFAYLSKDYLILEKSKINMMVVVFAILGALTLSFMIQFVVAKQWRKQLFSILKK